MPPMFLGQNMAKINFEYAMKLNYELFMIYMEIENK